jgi:hypothetical protein
VVDGVTVIEVQVGVEVSPQSCEGRIDVARKRWSPALVEDRLVQRLDVAVGLRTPGVDSGVLDVEFFQQAGELDAAELVAVV